MNEMLLRTDRYRDIRYFAYVTESKHLQLDSVMSCYMTPDQARDLADILNFWANTETLPRPYKTKEAE
jgi:hypothetical protein